MCEAELLGEAEGSYAAPEGVSGLGSAASSEGGLSGDGALPRPPGAPPSRAEELPAIRVLYAAGRVCCGVWELRWALLRWGGAAVMCWRVAVAQVLPWLPISSPCARSSGKGLSSPRTQLNGRFCHAAPSVFRAVSPYTLQRQEVLPVLLKQMLNGIFVI